jgi:hypothetical protein
MRRLRYLWGQEHGIALIMAIGILGVLSIVTASLVYYSSANSRQASFESDSSAALNLAEAGANQALAILNADENSALDPNLLPATTTTYENGEVTWSGTLDWNTLTWTLTGVGKTDNPTGAADIERTFVVKVPMSLVVTSTPTNPAWNYIYVTAASSDPYTCDMIVNNNVSGETRLYVLGNLCLQNNADVTSSPLVVGGTLQLLNNSDVGSSSQRVVAYIEGQGGLSCKYGGGQFGASGGTWYSTCSPEASTHVYSKLPSPPNADNTPGVSTAIPSITPPNADYSSWYSYAVPGPNVDCTNSNGARSGTPPTWDNNATRDASVTTVFDLTPAGVSYTCRVGPADSPAGELSWNHTTGVLTVLGTMFIDGSVKVGQNAVAQYNGFATIYLNGTLLFENNARLCGQYSGANCDWDGWDPNSELLVFVAAGTGGQAGTGNSVKLSQNAQFQGAFYAESNVTIENNAKTDGPMLADTTVLVNNAIANDFPLVATAPAGIPGNPVVKPQLGDPVYLPN